MVYYKRTSQSEEKLNVYMISSANGTTFSAPVLINGGGPFGRDPDYSFIGDYIGIDATTVRQPVWMDAGRTKPNQPTKHRDDIYTATVSGC